MGGPAGSDSAFLVERELFAQEQILRALGMQTAGEREYSVKSILLLCTLPSRTEEIAVVRH